MQKTTDSCPRLYINATIITVNTDREIILDCAMLVDGDCITAISKRSDLVAECQTGEDIELFNCYGGIILPVLINTHAHLAQSLLRGLAEDLDLHSWLCDAIWPLEAAFEGNNGYVAAKLTIAEILLSGTTTCLEAMLTHRAGMENIVRAVEDTGIRGCLGKLVKPVETNANVGMTDARDRDLDAMSIEAAVDAHTRYGAHATAVWRYGWLWAPHEATMLHSTKKLLQELKPRVWASRCIA